MKRRSGWFVVDGEPKWIRPEPRPAIGEELRALLEQMAAKPDSHSPW
jgi:hypothetical protein